MTTTPFGGFGPLTSLQNPPGGAVPGGPTPDPNAAAQQALGPSKEQLALLTQALQQAATPRFAGGQQPVVPGQQQPMSPTPPGYMQQRPWGPERFMYGVQSAISQLSAAKQERDVRKAENMYTNMLTASQKYMKPDGTFDANAAAQDPYLSTLKDSDYKKMADTLQESWLNPKSTTPHKEGLKAAQAKFNAQQQQRGKLDKFIQGLIHKATGPLRGGPQLTPEQQQAQTAQILGRAPIGAAGGNMKDVMDLQKANLESAQIIKDLRENYTAANDWSQGGRLVAWDKSDPSKPAIPINTKDPNSGTTSPVTAKAPAKANTLITAKGGIPIGMWDKSGQATYPGDANWTPEMQKIFEAGQGAYIETDNLKIPVQVRDMVGDPPNPASYSGGRADPKYLADLRVYGRKVQNQIDQNAAFAGVSRVRAQQDARVIPGVDPTNPGVVSWTTAGYAISHNWETPQSADVQTVRRTQEYFATGQGGQQGVAFYTANLHADMLQRAADALNNKNTQALNNISNEWKRQTGDPAITNYDTIADAYTREVARMMSLTHVTDQEIKDAGAQLTDKSSPEQIRGAIDALKQLSQSKMWVLNKQRELGMQGKSIVGEPAGGGPSTGGAPGPAKGAGAPRTYPPGAKAGTFNGKHGYMLNGVFHADQ